MIRQCSCGIRLQVFFSARSILQVIRNTIYNLCLISSFFHWDFTYINSQSIPHTNTTTVLLEQKRNRAPEKSSFYSRHKLLFKHHGLLLISVWSVTVKTFPLRDVLFWQNCLFPSYAGAFLYLRIWQKRDSHDNVWQDKSKSSGCCHYLGISISEVSVTFALALGVYIRDGVF